MASLDPKTWINLERAVVLLVDDNPQGAQILRQLLLGFGVRAPIHCDTAAEAQELLNAQEVDLVVTNDALPDMSGFDLVRWIRHSKLDPNAFVSSIIVCGHTRRSDVQKARDCGANFIIAKPISTRVLMERVIWVAREKRPFLDTGNYLGPDRRFHDAGPPKSGGRRRGDPPPEAEGEAAAPEETSPQQSSDRLAS
jgi:DNA-binding response OmpR family regulator